MSKNNADSKLGASSLQFKLPVIAVLLVLVPLIIFLVITVQRSTSTLTRLVAEELESKSVIVVRNLNDFIAERIVDARVIAQADVLEGDDIVKLIKYLNEIIVADNWLDDIDVIDMTGKIIASSGEQNEKGFLLWELFPETEELFNKTGQVSQGDVLVSEMQILDSGPGLLFLTPITDATNTTVSKILALEVNMSSIQRIVALFDQGIIGEKYAYIVDNNGKVLMTADPTIQPFEEFPDLKIQPQLLPYFSEQGQVGHLSYIDHVGDKVIAAYADMDEFGINKSLDWSIVALAPLEEILSPVRATEQMLTMIGITIVFIIMLLALWLARKITRPLQLVVAQANRIGEGDYSQMLAVVELGEIGLLATSFNHMALARRDAEAALLASKELLHNVVDGFGPNSFVGLLTPEGNILLANESALAAAGLCLDDVLNVPLVDSYWFSYSPAIQQQIREALVIANNGTATRFDILIRGLGENAFFWIDLTIQPVFDQAGNVAYLVPSASVIQERKLAEEQLRLSEENLSITLNSIGDAVIATDSAGHITRMNPTAERLTGWPLSDALGLPLTEVFCIVSAKTRLPSINPVQLVMEHGKVVGLANHTALLARDGKEYQIADSAAPIRDAENTIVGVVLVFSDVTEKYQTESDLEHSEALFRNTFKLMPASLTLQTDEGVILNCSDAFCKQTGYLREEIIGQDASNLNLWADPSQRVNLRKTLQHDGLVDGLEFQLRRRDGSNTTMLMSARYMMINNKQLLLTFAHDISARKQAEIALQKAENLAQKMLGKAQKANAELSFQKFALDAHAIVSIADVNGNITYVNDKFCEISGYTRNELMGQSYRLVKSAKHSIEFFANLWLTISAGNIWQGEIENITKDGEHYWVTSTVVPSLNDTGKPMCYIAIDIDITKTKSTEVLLRRSQKMESIGALAGGLAHDFNNLLGIIIGNLDLIGRQFDKGDKLNQKLEAAQNAALRGAAMTRRLLNFSRQSADTHSPVNIGKVVNEFEELIRKSLTASITIDIDQADDLWKVEINPDEFEDALVNLSLNARDAMPNGGTLTIEMKNTILDSQFTVMHEGLKPGKYVEIALSDTGVGMEKDIVERIFDPFFTTKDKGDGTGLGLAMVYGFIQRSHGHISVYSEVNVGTTFRLYLPCAIGSFKPVQNLTELDAIQPKGTETILIVDDEVELAMVAKNILEKLGYTAICVHSGYDALQVLENTSDIDLVFSDVVMPGEISGLDLAALVAKQYPKIKILMTSGFTGKVNRSVQAEALLQKMLSKPYRDIELARRVRETLDEVSIDGD